MTENRQIKSSVFTDLFGDDELVGKKNFLALYNALHGTDLKFEETHMERKLIPQSLIKTFNTDVTMEINGRLIVFVEHQSTINNNMPLRFLEYFVHVLYGIVPVNARYKKKLYKIPSPEFCVLYNGVDPMPKEVELKLSDAYLVPQKDLYCELKVKVLNIGGREGLKLPIVQKCDILEEYCKFMEMILSRETSLKPESTKEEAIASLEEVVRECIKKGILADYLTRKGTEVINMFFDEYDYDTDIAVQREEAMEEGIEKGIEETAFNMILKNYPANDISEITGLPLEKILELQKSIPAQA